MKTVQPKTVSAPPGKKAPFFSNGSGQHFFQSGQSEGSFFPAQTHQLSRKPIFESEKRVTGLLQKKCKHCEEQEKVQRKPGNVPFSGEGSVASPEIESKIQNRRGKGQSMDTATKSSMESSFGADFGSVKIHTDNNAAQMSGDMNAHAFTVGNDIFFNKGQYSPQTKKGEGLLAHELTHTVQQGAAEAHPVQKKGTPAPAKPTLKKSQVDTPTTSDCGSFQWKIMWDLNNAASTTNGWIVQKVELAADGKKCAGGAVDFEPGDGLKPSWYPMWEAWEVKSGVIYGGPSSNPKVADIGYSDGFGNTGTYDDSKGSLAVKGTAEYYDGLTLPSTFKVTNGPPAGILPTTKTAPTLTGGTGGIAHNLTATWDCCGSDKTTKIKTV